MRVLQASDSKLCTMLGGDVTDPIRPNTDGWAVCPSDSQAANAWSQIAKLAEAHALIVQEYSGVMVLATPEAQRCAESQPTMRDDVLCTHKLRETVAVHGQDRP
jgi:hypothetical protein